MNLGPDMCVPCGDGLLNLRVGAIIIRNGKVLMVKSAQGYCYSIGGRIRFGERAEDAIVREVREETGATLSIDRLGCVSEVYFINDTPQKQGKIVYELALYYYMNTPEDFEPIADHVADGEEQLVWMAPDAKETIFPDFFREAVLNPQQSVRFHSRDDRDLRR